MFDAYPLPAAMVGAHPVPVPLSPDGHQDLGGLLAALDHRARVMVLCNPHNPTRSLSTAGALSAFLRQLPRHITGLPEPVKAAGAVESAKYDQDVFTSEEFSP